MGHNSNFPADDGFLAEFPAGMREETRAVIEDMIVDAMKVQGLAPGNGSGNIPVNNGNLNLNLNAEKHGGKLVSELAAASHTHTVASAGSNGFMSNTDKSKLDGVAARAEVNQNAFSNVLVGSTTIQADAKTDTLELVGGTNIALTPDATNDRVTVGISGTIPVANGGTGATTAAAALSNLGLTATAAELNTLDGITASAAELNFCDGVTSNIQTQFNGKAATGQPFYLGTTQVAINRASGALTLAGVSIGGNAATASSCTGNAATATTAAACTGNSATATAAGKLTAAKTISITGAVTGSASTDLSGNVTILTANGTAGSTYDAGHSFVTNGYQKLSNGLILQWGITNSSTPSLTFPISFPNACFGAWACSQTRCTSGYMHMECYSVTANGCSISMGLTDVGTINICVYAIGN